MKHYTLNPFITMSWVCLGMMCLTSDEGARYLGACFVVCTAAAVVSEIWGPR